ncbi:acylneuraminate cytidylyltransferase family protein [Alphaproteobacteria bacterium]|nr:acylneuraminate cytidylyltransferase family protein [Alphaproteobacteria bacterium]
MYDQKVLSVITARGGSRRLPKKNLRKLGNQTLLERTVKASIGSKNISQTILSSDCPTIIKEALKYGCDVPFIRPAKLATSSAKSEDVLEHAIKNLPGFYWILLLQPTSPFRTSEDIDLALRLAKMFNCNSCVGVTQVQPGNHRNEQNLFTGDVLNSNAQNPDFVDRECKTKFILNGAIYLIKASHFLRTKKLVTGDTIGIEMSAKKSIDIDTIEDFDFASKLMEV